MYNRAGTPFGGRSEVFQTIQITEDRAAIQPNSLMKLLTLILLVLFLAPGYSWLRDFAAGRTERLPELWEAALAYGMLCLGLVLFWAVNGQSMVIDEYGVTWRCLFRKRDLRWREIHDFGLSYAYWGQVRLYFAEERLETNGKGKKRMEGRHTVILIHIQNRNKTGNILNICRQYTRIRPFLCSEEGKLAGILKDR